MASSKSSFDYPRAPPPTREASSASRLSKKGFRDLVRKVSRAGKSSCGLDEVSRAMGPYSVLDEHAEQIPYDSNDDDDMRSDTADDGVSIGDDDRYVEKEAGTRRNPASRVIARFKRAVSGKGKN